MQRPESAHLNSMINAGLGLDEELFLRSTDIPYDCGYTGELVSSQTLESINRERMEPTQKKNGLAIIKNLSRRAMQLLIVHDSSGQFIPRPALSVSTTRPAPRRMPRPRVALTG